jgi:hypothetical protein
MQSDANEKLLPLALRDQACTIAKTGHTVTVDCEDATEANKLFDWLTALSAPHTPSEPVAWLYTTTAGNETLRIVRTDDIELGDRWTKDALYAHPAPRPVASDLEARLREVGNYPDVMVRARIIEAADAIATLTARVATLEAERDTAFAKGRDAAASAVEAAGFPDVADDIRALKNQG